MVRITEEKKIDPKKSKDEWYEEEFEKIHEDIKTKTELSHYDFLRIINYKTLHPTQAKHECINCVTFKAFNLAKDHKKIKEAITLLTMLHGVRIPTASAILAMRFPKEYAIIDINVINALNKIKALRKEKWRAWRKGYITKPEIYEQYLNLMRNKAKREKKELRKYELELFKEGQQKPSSTKRNKTKKSI